MTARMRGIYSSRTIPILEVNGSLITDPAEVANALAMHYENISSGATYTDQFNTNRASLESTLPDFHTNEYYHYNAPITQSEATSALKLCTNSAPGEDKITYEMLRNIHPTLLKFLVDIYNHILKTGIYPTT